MLSLAGDQLHLKVEGGAEKKTLPVGNQPEVLRGTGGRPPLTSPSNSRKSEPRDWSDLLLLYNTHTESTLPPTPSPCPIPTLMIYICRKAKSHINGAPAVFSGL